jgi:FAD:protein FMN transferase
MGFVRCLRRTTLACSVLAVGLASLSCLHQPDHTSPAVVKRGQMLMGTLVFVTAVAEDQATANAAASAAFVEISRLESLLSTWIPTSDLSRLNAAAGRAPITVSTDTMDLLKRSVTMAELTGGGFNIALGPAVEAWNVNEQPRIPSEEELARLRPLIDLSGLQLNDRDGTVYLARDGMRVDVSGIGKGFAVDRAVGAMRQAGAIAGVIALSGDIKTFGEMPDGHPFVFGIQHPREPLALIGRIALKNEAISTAGDYERFFERDGVRYHHILDPNSLRPARGCQSVTIVAKEGVMADGLDTGIFTMGPEQGMALIERLADVEGIIVDSQGHILVSSGLKGRVMLNDPAYK